MIIFMSNPLVGLLLLLMSAAAFISIKIGRKKPSEPDGTVLTTGDVLTSTSEGDLSSSSAPYYNTTDLESMKSGTYHENPHGDPSKVAILFATNQCDPNVYQGDPLKLRGCVNDSRNTLSYLLKKGFGKVWYNEDSDCSIANFLRVWKSATSELKDGATLVLQRSGHGMSLGMNVLDRKGDNEVQHGEYSGDQAAVMYDGVIVDDCFWRLFLTLPKIKLIYINDSCFSASQYKIFDLPISIGGKAKAYRKARSVGKEYLPVKDHVLDVHQLDREFGKPASTVQKFDLISISGCQDWQTSADAYINGKYAGAMTHFLLEVLKKDGNKPLSEVGAELTAMLKAQGFEQEPKITVEGDQSLLDRPLF